MAGNPSCPPPLPTRCWAIGPRSVDFARILSPHHPMATPCHRTTTRFLPCLSLYCSPPLCSRVHGDVLATSRAVYPRMCSCVVVVVVVAVVVVAAAVVAAVAAVAAAAAAAAARPSKLPPR